MTSEIIMSGFGGQGIMLIGQLMAYAGMLENKQVSWIPSYGPEMRGGTANCSVIVSKDPIGAPIVTEPNALVAMNLPSLDKFEASVQPNGVIIVNSSLIDKQVQRKDINTFYIAANELAAELGNPKVANMIILGALIEATHAVNTENILKAFSKMFAKKPSLLSINEKAVRLGGSKVQQ